MSKSLPPPRLATPTATADGADTWVRPLRAPIAAIREQARQLLEAPSSARDQRRSLLSIEQNAARLAHLLDQMEPGDPPRPAGDRIGGSGVFESPIAPSLLLADDDPEILELLKELLGDRYLLAFARDGAEALAALRAQTFHLAIIDLNLPMLDGFEVVEALRAAGDRRLPAFMFLSAQASPRTKVHALSLGAVDYVTKPFDVDELTARIARIVATVSREASLHKDAMTDSLTGLANYRSFAQSLERELDRSRRYAQPLSLLTLDLDHLKSINDDHGHDAGNEAIRLVAEVLQGAVRSFDVVARQGGDEFAILLPNTGPSEAHHLAERLRGEIARRAVCDVPLSASVGVASRDALHDFDGPHLVKASDEALYCAKFAGRNRVCVAPAS